jgi:dihydrofolate synthase / folylpolyglutamate synthase
MDYSQSLKWLEELASFGIKTGIEHTRTISSALGSKDKDFSSILVGGTNGKGSTAAYLESILRAAGFKTGLYTSPHLVDVRERIQVGGACISRDDFARYIASVKNAYEELKKKNILDEPPTFFEALTLASFLYLGEKKVDIAVLEVGLGGRLDCTNVVEPVLSIVTNVSFDHEIYLGDTLEKISVEKAGIFRKDKPAFAGRTCGHSFCLLKREAENIGAKLTSLDDFELSKQKDGFLLKRGAEAVHFPDPPLPGEHQLYNAALAAAAVLQLRTLGFLITGDAVTDGIKNTRWFGRLQKIGDAPAVYLDGAHNLDGCMVLADFVRKLKGKKVLVFSGMADKPLEAMVKTLAPAFDEIILTTIPSMKRAVTKDELLTRAKYFSHVLVEEPTSAITMAKDWAGRKGTVIVAGSLYLVGYVLKQIEDKNAPLWGTGL